MEREILHKEIDLIQSIIKRMANNSFLLKGWVLSLVAIVLATKDDVLSIAASFLIIVAFWYLDAYFLRQERLYRALYSWIIKNRNEGSDEFLYDLNTTRFSKDVSNVVRTMFSHTLLTFYSIPFLLIIGMLIYSILK